MKSAIRTIWAITSIAVLLATIWFLFASTAIFQKSIDLVTTVIFICAWTPALILVGLSFFLLKKGWLPGNIFAQIGLLIVILLLAFLFITTFFRYSSTRGWLKESVTKDYLQTTVDGKYEYRIEVVNIFQKNSFVRLYMRDIATGEEIKIPLDIPIQKIGVIHGGEGSISPEPDTLPTWSELTPTDTEAFYVLTTTDNFFRGNIYSFKIDIRQRDG